MKLFSELTWADNGKGSSLKSWFYHVSHLVGYKHPPNRAMSLNPYDRFSRHQNLLHSETRKPSSYVALAPESKSKF